MMRLSYGKIGLGPNGLGILRYLLPYNSLFHCAARAHDIGYERGGDEHDRVRSDLIFLKMCLAVSKGVCIKRFFAYAYYKAVKRFGKYYFKYKVSYKC